VHFFVSYGAAKIRLIGGCEISADEWLAQVVGSRPQ